MKSRDGRHATLEAGLRERFGESAEASVATAPGRVNLIGEHTDYNEGWVLPMAIDRHVAVAFRPAGSSRLRAYSVAFDEALEIDLAAPESPAPGGWKAYVAGMAWTMIRAGHDVSGIDCVIDGNVPLGAGLSSSAALEMAVARALCGAADLAWSPREMARLGQRAEHDFVGVQCGLMDQLASALAEPGCAMLLDCRSLASGPVPVPEAAAVVIMDSGVRRALVTSAYNERRASCESMVEVARGVEPGVRALRDVDSGLLERLRGQLDELTYRRARHVVEENARPEAMTTALRDGDLAAAGRLMNESHASLRDLLDVSCVELDLMTDLARAHPACFGARLTGAGFGGCAVALVGADGVDTFVADVQSAYRAQLDLPGELFACRPAAGARLVRGSPGAEAAESAELAQLEG